DRLQKANEQCESLMTANQAFENKLAKLVTELDVSGVSIEDLERRLTTKTEQLERVSADLAGAVTDNDQQQEELARAYAENELQQAKTHDLMARLKQVVEDHEASLKANEDAQVAIRGLQEEIHRQTETIRALRRQRGSIADLEGGDRNAA
ncbi:MAG: hypothetical protein AAGJ83_02485, partial [Planctomycetota bacterium]